jgi:hypothetical protein
MMKKLVVIFSCFTSGYFAQSNVFQIQDTTLATTNHFELKGNIDYQGTSLRNELFGKFLFGGDITDEIIQNSKAEINSRNRLGLFGTGMLKFNCGKATAFKNDKISWFVQAGTVGLANLNYTTDAYTLLFDGNTSYINDTANLTNIRFDAFLAQKFGFGVRSKDNLSSLAFNIYSIQNYAQVFVRKGSWYQDSTISMININMNGDFAYTEGDKFSKGIGVGIDFEYRFKTDWVKNSKAWFRFSVSNLGLAFLNQPLTRYQFNDTIDYSGFTVKDLIDENSALNSDFSLLDSLGIEKKEGRSITTIPSYIQVEKMIDQFSVKKLQVFFGLRLFASIQGVPTGFAGLYYKPTKNFALSSSVAYGGFGNFRGGFYLNYQFEKGLIVIGSDDIYGTISKNGFGKSLNARLVWRM